MPPTLLNDSCNHLLKWLITWLMRFYFAHGYTHPFRHPLCQTFEPLNGSFLSQLPTASFDFLLFSLIAKCLLCWKPHLNSITQHWRLINSFEDDVLFAVGSGLLGRLKQLKKCFDLIFYGLCIPLHKNFIWEMHSLTCSGGAMLWGETTNERRMSDLN